MATLLVAGGDGPIGSAVAAQAASAGWKVLSTTRRPERAGASRPMLDLASPQAQWPRVDADAVVLCAAQTSVDACEADPAGTRRINVEAPAAFVAPLVARGAFVCLPSTTLVFDGERAGCAPGDPISPRCEYARQKAELETALFALAPGGAAAVRLGKVISLGVPLFAGWVEALRCGRNVRAFGNVPIAPLALDTAAAVLLAAATERASGIFHFTAARDASYADVARALAELLGVPAERVDAVDAPAGMRVPKHAALDSRATALRFGIAVPEPLDALRALTGPRAAAGGG